MIKIRNLKKQDISSAEYICLITAAKEIKDTPKKALRTLLMYNRCYTRTQSSCFVAENENGRVVGYILCAESLPKYLKGFFGTELQEIFKISFTSGIVSFFEAVSPAAFSVKYPAHLHIDILPEYQGQKVGTALMSALKEKLVSDNIKGVMLCVGKGNVRAIKFYKKNGFKVIIRLFGAVFMGLNLPQS